MPIPLSSFNYPLTVDAHPEESTRLGKSLDCNSCEKPRVCRIVTWMTSLEREKELVTAIGAACQARAAGQCRIVGAIMRPKAAHGYPPCSVGKDDTKRSGKLKRGDLSGDEARNRWQS